MYDFAFKNVDLMKIFVLILWFHSMKGFISDKLQIYGLGFASLFSKFKCQAEHSGS